MTRFKRSTAASKAWMTNARPQCCCQAPLPRSGAPKAQGLIAALRPQHNPPCRRALPAAAPTANNISTGANAFMAPQLQFRISTSLTDVTIAGVAVEAGFRDQSHFGRWSRRAFGVTSGRYRSGWLRSQMYQTRR
jgi:AraC-like DNA-binding protein